MLQKCDNIAAHSNTATNNNNKVALTCSLTPGKNFNARIATNNNKNSYKTFWDSNTALTIAAGIKFSLIKRHTTRVWIKRSGPHGRRAKIVGTSDNQSHFHPWGVREISIKAMVFIAFFIARISPSAIISYDQPYIFLVSATTVVAT